MTSSPEPTPSVIASGLLEPFAVGGVLGIADVQVARRIAHMYGETDEVAVLALALTVRALGLGSICLVLDRVRADVEASLETEAELPWPDDLAWRPALTNSLLVTHGDAGPGLRPLRMVDGRVYLERFWAEQEVVRAQLVARSTAPPPPVDDEAVARHAAHLSAGDRIDSSTENLQLSAAETVARSWVAVIAGGPGTGKTTTVARALALVAVELGRVPSVALAAPSGRAAARLQEAVRSELARLPIDPEVRAGLAEVEAHTLHRLLGWQPWRRYRHSASNPLPHDVVVVDEMSMVSLSMMARLLPAVRTDARLVLVGDPEQLAPVDAGAVLADITAAAEASPPGQSPLPLVRLRHTWRFDGDIKRLAEAIREGDSDEALTLLSGGERVRLVTCDDAGRVTERQLEPIRERAAHWGVAVHEAAEAGDAGLALAALRGHRVLCAHRTGPFGVSTWSRAVEQWIRNVVPAYGTGGEWHVGRPLLITRNDSDLDLANGDAGVIVATPVGVRAAFDRGDVPLLLPPGLLDDVQTMHAMTVHKGQGSQFDTVTVVLPLTGPMLTRELLYTAVTRAKEQVTIIAHPDAVRRAVDTQALRASGLRQRLGWS